MPFKAKKSTPINKSDLHGSVKDLAKYTEDEFAAVASAIQDPDAQKVNYTAPPKPRQGQLIYADGTHFNPGNGEGFYGVNSAGAYVPAFDTSIPKGGTTVMLFYMAAAPSGWTKLTTQNDKALRVVSGSGGVAGGTNAFSTVMAQTVVGSHTLTLAEIPSHAHSVTDTHSHQYTLPTFPGGGTPFNSGAGLSVSNTTPQTSGTNSGGITVNANGGGGSHNHTITMAIQYIDLILASKD